MLSFVEAFNPSLLSILLSRLQSINRSCQATKGFFVLSTREVFVEFSNDVGGCVNNCVNLTPINTVLFHRPVLNCERQRVHIVADVDEIVGPNISFKDLVLH